MLYTIWTVRFLKTKLLFYIALGHFEFFIHVSIWVTLKRCSLGWYCKKFCVCFAPRSKKYPKQNVIIIILYCSVWINSFSRARLPPQNLTLLKQRPIFKWKYGTDSFWADFNVWKDNSFSLPFKRFILNNGSRPTHSSMTRRGVKRKKKRLFTYSWLKICHLCPWIELVV